jgi:predicted  nucleic acid-binding Zn-ribbon protein
MRIGRALDDLAQDESRATRQLEQVTRDVEALDPRTHVLARALVHDVRVAQKHQSSDALHELLSAAATWADAQESLHRLRGQLNEKQTECEDLRFQMAQLKGRLGTLNAEAAIEMDAARHRTHKLDTTTQAVLERMGPESERISAHLAGFPQLRAQLARP